MNRVFTRPMHYGNMLESVAHAISYPSYLYLKIDTNYYLAGYFILLLGPTQNE